MNRLLPALIFAFSFNAVSQSMVYDKQVFIKNGSRLPYRILKPTDFDEEKRYPVVFFLHGAGERGTDNESQLTHGSKVFQDSIQKYPAIVIFPQCPKDDYWSNVERVRDEYGYNHFFKDGGEMTTSMGLLTKLVDSIKDLPYTDNKRIYVGGLSMGGMGTFEIAYRMPDTFAAAFSICGGGDMDSAKKYAGKIPFWIFHGAKDDIVNPYHSIKMRKAIADAGGDVKLTLYPEANHNSWDQALAEPQLLNWIFSHSKK